MNTLRVRDLMTQGPMTLGPEDDAAALYDLMDSQHVRHVPVVDEEGCLVGLVSHRDLFRCALGENSDLPLSTQRDILGTMTVGDIMTTSIETVEPDTNLDEAAQIMIDNKYGCLPVVDGTELVGILTESDFVRFVSKTQAGGSLRNAG